MAYLMHAPRIVVPKPVAERNHTCHALFNAFERFAKKSTVKVTPPTTNSKGSFKRTRLSPIQTKPKLEISKDIIEVTIFDEPVKPTVKLEMSKDVDEVTIIDEMLSTCKPSKDFENKVRHKKEYELKNIVIKQRIDLYNKGREIVELRQEIERLTQRLSEDLSFTGNDIAFLIQTAYFK